MVLPTHRSVRKCMGFTGEIVTEILGIETLCLMGFGESSEGVCNG